MSKVLANPEVLVPSTHEMSEGELLHDAALAFFHDVRQEIGEDATLHDEAMAVITALDITARSATQSYVVRPSFRSTDDQPELLGHPQHLVAMGLTDMMVTALDHPDPSDKIPESMHVVIDSILGVTRTTPEFLRTFLTETNDLRKQYFLHGLALRTNLSLSVLGQGELPPQPKESLTWAENGIRNACELIMARATEQFWRNDEHLPDGWLPAELKLAYFDAAYLKTRRQTSFIKWGLKESTYLTDLKPPKIPRPTPAQAAVRRVIDLREIPTPW